MKNNSTKKKLIMVSSRFGGKDENVLRAEFFCKYVVRCGFVPIAPHVFFPAFLDDLNEEERKLGLEGSLRLLEACDEVWFFLEKGEDLSPGMKLEAELMIKLGLPYKVIDAEMVLDKFEEEEMLESICECELCEKENDSSFAPRFTGKLDTDKVMKQFDEQDWHLIYRNNED